MREAPDDAHEAPARACRVQFPGRPHLCKLSGSHDAHECRCGVRWVDDQSNAIAELERKLEIARAVKRKG